MRAVLKRFLALLVGNFFKTGDPKDYVPLLGEGPLPYSGHECGPFRHDGGSGFYGYCVVCGETYSPVCDR
jgi:hypothetical protein